jgi:hypothetical protein
MSKHWVIRPWVSWIVLLFFLWGYLNLISWVAGSRVNLGWLRFFFQLLFIFFFNFTFDIKLLVIELCDFFPFSFTWSYLGYGLVKLKCIGPSFLFHRFFIDLTLIFFLGFFYKINNFLILISYRIWWGSRVNSG